jgi:iron(III) transport system substrate-binding protein
LSALARAAAGALAICLVAACVPAAPATPAIRLYTSVTQDTVDAVLDALAEQHPEMKVEVFRAPTGELDARIASELRSGGVGADVLWATDPLSIQRYAADGQLAPLPESITATVPAEYATETSVGTRLLNLVIVARADLEPAPTSWRSLTDPAYRDAVALPDPGFAGSAFAALGYFATADGYGIDFYRELHDNGALQVQSPGDVVTSVAEGRYKVGISLDKTVRDAADRGSPIDLVWPEPGAIALYSPVAVFAGSGQPASAQQFIEFLLSPEAQAAIATTGWQPVRDDVAWPYPGPVLTPDWPTIFGRQQQLLDEYRSIFGD